MIRIDSSHFSHVLAAVQRTESLPGGAIRGLPNGQVIDGLQGIQSFTSDLADAQKEFQAGRFRSALDQVKKLEVRFNCAASRWDSLIGSLVMDIRQGKRLKNLEKLKALKAAQIRMQQLVLPARKAFQDLESALKQAAFPASDHRSDHAHRESTPGRTGAPSDSDSDPSKALSRSEPSPSSEHWTPDVEALGSYATNYEFGTKVQLRVEQDGNVLIVPPLEQDRFYYLTGFDPPRVIRVRRIEAESILVFDSHMAREAMIQMSEIHRLIKSGIWVLTKHQAFLPSHAPKDDVSNDC